MKLKRRAVRRQDMQKEPGGHLVLRCPPVLWEQRRGRGAWGGGGALLLPCYSPSRPWLPPQNQGDQLPEARASPSPRHICFVQSLCLAPSENGACSAPRGGAGGKRGGGRKSRLLTALPDPRSASSHSSGAMCFLAIILKTERERE